MSVESDESTLHDAGAISPTTRRSITFRRGLACGPEREMSPKPRRTAAFFKPAFAIPFTFAQQDSLITRMRYPWPEQLAVMVAVCRIAMQARLQIHVVAAHRGEKGE